MKGRSQAGGGCSRSSQLCEKVEGGGAAAIRSYGVVGEGISDSCKKSILWCERRRGKGRRVWRKSS